MGSFRIVVRFTTTVDSVSIKPASNGDLFPGNLRLRKNWVPIPVPHRSIPEARGQDLDFINVAHSHLVHSDWDNLNPLATHLTPFRIRHILLRIHKDHVLSLEFFNWVKTHAAKSLTLETYSMVLHVLTRNKKFKSAELILRSVIVQGSLDFPDKLFNAMLHSYRMCESTPRVFDSLFRCYAYLRKFRNATDVFCRMKEYGFLPKVESCNAYLSSLLDLHRVDIVLGFYREMRQCRISPNVYTLNLVMHGYCKSGKVDKAVEVFREIESMGIRPNVASFNTLIAGHCNKGHLSLGIKLKNLMANNGLEPNIFTYNILINGFCKEGKLHEASKVFCEMKAMNVAPNTVTYTTLIGGYSQRGNSEMGSRLHEEMSRSGIKADILTYNALILGLCKEGKTKKAAYLVKELEKEKLTPNASTFSALICGQCVRRNSDRALQLYRSMIWSGYHPNAETYKMLISTLCSEDDFEGAYQLLMEMFKRCIAPDSNFILQIYDRLSCSGKNDLACKLRDEMEAQHLKPRSVDKADSLGSAPDQAINASSDNL